MIRIPQATRPCDVENIGDFGRYYRFSWIGWERHPEGPQPVNLQACTDTTVTVQDLRGRAYVQMWDEFKRQCSFGTPDLGMVNAPHTVVYLFRQAPREAHRGYRPGAIQHVLFNGWDIRNINGGINSGDRDVMRNVFYPEYYTPEEAREELQSGNRIGCALSRDLGLWTAAAYKYPNIAFKRRTIGYLDDRTAIIPRQYIDALPVLRDKLGVEVVIK